MDVKKIIIIVIILVFATIAVYSLRGVITPYVSFKDAKVSQSYVQIIGSLDKQIPVRYGEGWFEFTIRDRNNDSMRVVDKGTKPMNFEHTSQVVALGTFNRVRMIFEADKILVKCPSKYKKEE
jgi:cytochrome c-type biogenesis protein CcmE